MITSESIESVINSDVYDMDGDKIGTVGQVYLDDATGQPSWVSVSTGWFGASQSFAPLRGADLEASGALRLPYSKDVVKDAPRVEADQHLSPEEEADLFAHYQHDYDDWDDNSASDAGDLDPDRAYDTRAEDRIGEVDRDNETVAGGDDVVSVTRSEERLKVGTEQVETARARLRKYVTTEEKTVTVPVHKEVLHVERTPVEGTVTGDAIVDRDEQIEEIVLREERPVVGKETVEVENVRIGKETVTEDRQVTETVATEHVDLDGDDITDDTALRSDDDRSFLDKADDRSFLDKAKGKLDDDPRT